MPPLIYALMGSSRELAIGPVAVVSLLLSSLVPQIQDPDSDPVAYTRTVFTVTFFAGLFQASFGIFRSKKQDTTLDLIDAYKNFRVFFFNLN